MTTITQINAIIDSWCSAHPFIMLFIALNLMLYGWAHGKATIEKEKEEAELAQIAKRLHRIEGKVDEMFATVIELRNAGSWWSEQKKEQSRP
jgi:hypothetical protein